MDLTTIAIAAVLLLVLLALAVGGFLWVRRRTVTQDEPQKTKGTAAQAAPEKISAKPPAHDRVTANNKPAQPQLDEPTAPAVTVEAAAAPAPSAKQVKESKLSPEEKIHILIVDDNEGTRGNVTRLLYFEDDLEVVGQALNGRQGIEMALELKPHIVLMDINMPDMDGITATQQLGMQAPFSQVIIMSVQADQHYMKRAMAAGARDFQPKPFTSEELVTCIRRVYNLGLPIYQNIEATEQAQLQQATQLEAGEQAQRNVEAPMIAVYGPKGGVGTSAIASNLAVALQKEQGNTVLMDAALQFGDIMVHLNSQATHTISNLIHKSELEVDLIPQILVPHNSGLKLLLGPPKPSLAEGITPAMLMEIINDLKQKFKIVVVDTDSQLTDKNLAVLNSADDILIVTTPELPAVNDTILFLEMIDHLQIDRDRLKVVINRADVLGAIPPSKIKEILSLKQAYYIPHDPRMEVALRNGLPVCQKDTSAPSSVAIVDMVRHMCLQLAEAEAVVEVV
jgi:pilus assembly protein CpaE